MKIMKAGCNASERRIRQNHIEEITMTRIAIYARYSTDLQRQSSIEDQIRLCEERASANGGEIVQSYTDHAVSGASLMRPGIQMLMQDAAAGKFDVLYSEALDRISRDQEDIAAVYKRLSFAGIAIITLSEGEISTSHRPERHHERLVPERLGRQNPPWLAWSG